MWVPHLQHSPTVFKVGYCVSTVFYNFCLYRLSQPQGVCFRHQPSNHECGCPTFNTVPPCLRWGTVYLQSFIPFAFIAFPSHKESAFATNPRITNMGAPPSTQSHR